jgi:hypothetical protein
MLMQEGLLNAPSGAELAWQRQVLYDDAIALAARIAAVSYSCRILENQLEEAVRFLGSDERPPATQLHEKLTRFGRLVTLVKAAVLVHEEAQHRHSPLNTPPQNPPPVQITGAQLFSAPPISAQTNDAIKLQEPWPHGSK